MNPPGDWFTLLQAFAIAAGFFFNGWALLMERRSRRLANLLHLTTAHREIWEKLLSHPALRRVTDPSAPLDAEPVTADEVLFLSLLINHIHGVWHAGKSGLLPPTKELGADLRDFFNRPIPRAVWEKLRPFQDPAFVAYLESHLGE